MASFNKYQAFAQDLGRKVHDLNGDTLRVLLSNTAPNASTHAVRGDTSELSTGGGYTSGGGTVANTGYSQSGGVGALVGDDVVFTATAGGIGPFRYAILYNDTPTSPTDPLIGWWDYTSSITLADGESLTVDFGANILTVT